MEALRDRLYVGMVERGIVGPAADQVFTSLAAFASFGFPRSPQHRSPIVYASAWLKLRYPAAFLASLLNSQPMGFWSPATLVADARRHGSPCTALTSTSVPSASLERMADGSEPAVRLGLSSVSGIGSDIAHRIALPNDRRTAQPLPTLTTSPDARR